MEVMTLTRDQVVEIWGDLEPYIARALDRDYYGQFSTDDIVLQVDRGYAHVQLAHEDGSAVAVVVIQMLQRANGDKAMHILTLSGERAEEVLRAAVPTWREIASQEGCAYLTMAGRPGWTRLLTKHGFRTKAVEMEVDLSEHVQHGEQPIPITEPGK